MRGQTVKRKVKWLGRLLAVAWLTVWVSLAMAMPAQATVWLAESDSSDSDWGPFALLALGPIVYFAIYGFYRNPAARHKYETDTDVKIDHLEQTDQPIGSRKGTRDAVLPGANSTKLLGNPLQTKKGN